MTSRYLPSYSVICRHLRAGGYATPVAKGTPIGTPVAGGTRWGSGATRVRGPRHYCVPLGPTCYLIMTVSSRTYFHVTPCNSHRCTRRPRAPTRTRPTPTAVARTTTAAGWACTTRRITYCSVRFVSRPRITYCSVRFVSTPTLLPMCGRQTYFPLCDSQE